MSPLVCSNKASSLDVDHAVQPRTDVEIAKAEGRLLKRQNQKKRKLEEAGIKYNFDKVAYVSVSCYIPFVVLTFFAEEEGLIY